MPLEVVYIDDEVDLLEIFAEEFSNKDVHVRTFADQTVALEELKQHPADVVFLDYQLRGTTGDKVAQMMDPEVPKYLITGNLSLKTETKFLQILSKPFNFDDLTQLIELHLRKKSSAA